MNMRILIFLAGTLAFSGGTLHAGSRTSADYSIPADTVDAGGKRSTSADYAHDGSVGGISGISTAAAPAVSNYAGYTAQIGETASRLTLAATPSSVNETATTQLSAAFVADDSSVVQVPGSSVTWSVVSGPLTGINASGLATAGIVYQNTTALVQGVYSGFTATLGITVVNTLPDNFQSYAGDGLADDWQTQYFGINNPDAAPPLDPDGDGYNNLFEYAAQLVPTDRASTFNLRVDPAPGGSHALTFSPRIAGSNYTVQGSGDLSLWSLVNGTVTDNGLERTVVDPAGTAPRRYYRVQVQRQ